MDVLGANGQIYKGRLEEAGLLEAKMPSNNKFSRPQTSQVTVQHQSYVQFMLFAG